MGKRASEWVLPISFEKSLLMSRRTYWRIKKIIRLEFEFLRLWFFTNILFFDGLGMVTGFHSASEVKQHLILLDLRWVSV